MKIGEDSVVMGNVPSSTNVGNRSVVVGATDANGNTILNQPMAVGYGAKAGSGSIAIGAHANAGATNATPPAIPPKRWWLRLMENVAARVITALIMLGLRG